MAVTTKSAARSTGPVLAVAATPKAAARLPDGPERDDRCTPPAPDRRATPVARPAVPQGTQADSPRAAIPRPGSSLLPSAANLRDGQKFIGPTPQPPSRASCAASRHAGYAPLGTAPVRWGWNIMGGRYGRLWIANRRQVRPGTGILSAAIGVAEWAWSQGSASAVRPPSGAIGRLVVGQCQKSFRGSVASSGSSHRGWFGCNGQGGQLVCTKSSWRLSWTTSTSIFSAVPGSAAVRVS